MVIVYIVLIETFMIFQLPFAGCEKLFDWHQVSELWQACASFWLSSSLAWALHRNKARHAKRPLRFDGIDKYSRACFSRYGF
jgi:hypothetical protein